MRMPFFGSFGRRDGGFRTAPFSQGEKQELDLNVREKEKNVSKLQKVYSPLKCYPKRFLLLSYPLYFSDSGVFGLIACFPANSVSGYRPSSEQS